MKPFKMYQVLYLLAAILFAACGNNPKPNSQSSEAKNWPDPDKEQFMKYCTSHLKEHNSSKAQEVCDCILKNAIEKYPNAEHADTLDQSAWEAIVVSSNCVEAELLKEQTSWGKAEEDEFTRQCIAAAVKKSDKQEDATRFCACALEKVKVTLPNPHLTNGLTEEEYDKVIAECETGK